MQRREFLHLGNVFDEVKHSIGGWFVSEKLDGVRCFWDGGITRGLPIEEVPFANLSSNEIRINKQYASGLWSRYGHPYQAPDWFLDRLPNHNLDGELYLGRKRFEETISIVKQLVPDERWREVKYMAFDAPATSAVFQVGEIKNPNYHKAITSQIAIWMMERQKKPLSPRTFQSTVKFLEMLVPTNETLRLVKQEQLPFAQVKAIDKTKEEFLKVRELGGEGLMVRNPASVWTPKRNWCTLKVKGKEDAEGVIIGFKSGEVGKTGKVHGKIGAITVNFGGIIFDLSGLEDVEREFATAEAIDWALNHPGQVAPNKYEGKNFKRGEIITFTYAGLSAKNVPKEARYLRKRVD